MTYNYFSNTAIVYVNKDTQQYESKIGDVLSNLNKLPSTNTKDRIFYAERAISYLVAQKAYIEPLSSL